jgi:PAS domain-containing protein
MDKQKPSELEIALQTIEHLKNRLEVLEKGRAKDLEQILKVNEQLKKESIIALRESEEKYRTLFEDSRDAIYMTTRDGSFIDVNESALDLFGYTREEMIGMNAEQTYVNPEDRRQFQQEIEEKGSVRHYEIKL